MSRINGNALIFDEDDVKTTMAFLPRLMRIIFYRKQITNDIYLERYEQTYKSENPDKTKKEFSQKSAADRKFILDPSGLTVKMMLGVLNNVGYDVEAFSVRLRDRVTGETEILSTDQTVDDLKTLIAKDNEFGISSIV